MARRLATIGPQVEAAHGFEVMRTQKPHDAVDLAAVDLQHLCHAGLARHGQAPELRARDQHRVRPQHEGLDDIGAAPDAAVHQHGHTALHGVDDRRQRFQRTRSTVELPAAVVGDDEPVDTQLDRASRFGRVQHALQQQRPRPLRAQLRHVVPVHGRVEQRRHAPGQRGQRFAGPRAHVVAEGQAAQLLAHRPGPAPLARHAQPLRQREARRDRKAVGDITLALAQQLVVDRQHQRLAAGVVRHAASARA